MKISGFLFLIVTLGLICPKSFIQSDKGWNGIVPLHSKRADVEQRLGVSQDECQCIYHTEKEIVYVDYTKTACKGSVNGWNVPTDTVLQFTVTPRTKPPSSELCLDESVYVKTSDSPMTTYYTNVSAGITYAVQNSKVMYVEYIPSSKDRYLRCEGFPDYDGGVTQYRPYATFSIKTDDDMFARLDDFASQLATGDVLVGYIVTYAGRVSKKGEAKLIANRAKQYLVDKRSISPERMIPIDGGFREFAEIEVYLLQNTAPPPTPSPTLSSNEVRIIGKATN